MGWRARPGLVVVGVLLAAGSVVVSCSSDGGTAAPPPPELALIDAAGRGDTDMVRTLLAQGTSTTATDDQGRTALVAAAYGAHLDAAKLLMEAGADVNTKDDREQSAYLIATSEIGEKDGLELLRLTLAHGADVASLDRFRGTGLIRAADRGYAGIVEELLSAGTEVDHVNSLGWTALLEAIILGGGDDAHIEVIRQLVNGGADVNQPDSAGTTPLRQAAQRGYSEIVAILQLAGARA